MEISRYASRLAPTSGVLPSGRPPQHDEVEVDAESLLSGQLGRFGADPFQFPRDMPQEPEDALLTGGTRSLSRRLLALNFPALSASRNPLPKISREASVQKPKVRKIVLDKAGMVA